MSRIGNKVIPLPSSVTITVSENNYVVVKGPKGQLEFQFTPNVSFDILEKEIVVKRNSDSKLDKTLHGTTRAVLNNMVVGVTEGFKKQLEIRGVGYRAQLQGKKLIVSAGYSHNVELDVPAGLTVELPKNTEIIVSGCDKQLVGEFSANIRAIRKPEPYKGKGIKYADEVIRRKVGKTGKK